MLLITSLDAFDEDQYLLNRVLVVGLAICVILHSCVLGTLLFKMVRHTFLPYSHPDMVLCWALEVQQWAWHWVKLWDTCMHAQSLSHVWLFAALWTAAHQVPPSMQFLRQESWSGLPFPPLESPPNPGIETETPVSPALQAILYLSATREAQSCGILGHRCVQVIFVYLKNTSQEYPGEGNGYPLQYSCLENSMDRGAWWAAVHGVANSQTRLSD